MDYLPLINDYGQNLTDYQKPIAKKLFKQLLNNGWSYEQIFWGLMLLKGRPIDQYKGLFFYQDFIDEINEKVESAREMINTTYDKKVWKIAMIGRYGRDSIPLEYKDDLYILDDKIWNSGIDYPQEELEREVDFIYEKCCLIPLFTFPLELLDEYPF